MVGVAMFECNRDPFIEMNWIGEMKPVAHLVTRDNAFVQSRTIHQKCVILHSPSMVKIVLAPSPVKTRRPGVVINKDHFVALSPPATLKMGNRQVAAHIVPSTGRLKHDVFTRTIHIRPIASRPVTLY